MLLLCIAASRIANRNRSMIPCICNIVETTTNNHTTMTITIRILFFAAARDAVDGRSQIDLSFDSSIKNSNLDDESGTDTITSNTVRNHLMKEYPQLLPFLQNRDSITMALNEVYIAPDTDPIVQNNDVIAIIPPISGG